MTLSTPMDELSLVPTVKHKQAGLLQHYFHVPGVVSGLRGSQVGPEAGPSPGVLALSGRQLG